VQETIASVPSSPLFLQDYVVREDLQASPANLLGGAATPAKCRCEWPAEMVIAMLVSKEVSRITGRQVALDEERCAESGH